MTSIPLSPVRKVVGNHRSLTGLYKSRKMQRVVPYESALERDLFMGSFKIRVGNRTLTHTFCAEGYPCVKQWKA
jgi:hypothetical protein